MEQEYSRTSQAPNAKDFAPTRDRDRDIRPIPDPTRLTTEQLDREVRSLKEIVFTRLEGMDKALSLATEAITHTPTEAQRTVDQLKGLIETRLLGMDKAIDLVRLIGDKTPVAVDEKISALREIQEEKFLSIQVQFKERDVRTEQTSKDSKVAVDAALQAAKEAVGEQNKSSAMAISKSEASTVKQIDQMGLLITTQAKAVDDKFSDIKDRLTRIEGKDVGKVANEAVHQTSNHALYMVITTVIAAASVLIAIFVSFLKPH
jgi:hypothetical protein